MTFTNAGNYTYLVPIRVTTLKLQAWGGGGGAPGISGGGGGGYSEAHTSHTFAPRRG